MTTDSHVATPPPRWAWPWRESRGSIAVRLVLFAILLASVTAGLIGTLSYRRARSALEHQARTRLALLSRDVAEHLHRELEDRVADITNWSRLEIMRAVLYRDVDKEIAQFLQGAVAGRQLYRGIVCLDADGHPIAGAGDTAGLAPTTVPTLRPRVSLVSDDAGTEGLRLEAAIDHPDQAGTPIGTLVVSIDQRRLVDTIAASMPAAESQPMVTVRSTGGDRVVRTGGPAGVRDAAMLRGKTTAVGPLSNADGPAFEVVVAEPARIALAAAIELRATLVKLGLLALLVSSALGALVAWRISVPIGRLTETVRRITARRQLDDAVDFPHAGGEVGILTAAFQTMLQSLKAAQADALVQSRRAFLGEIAANVAHEVRTPLSVLKTSAQLLARQQLPPEEQKMLASNVAAEVDRLNGVVTALVDLARPQPARYRTEPLAAIVERAVAFFAPQVAKLGVTIVRAPPDLSLRVHGSADQLHQVLLNVISNALQAMAGPGRLGVRCYRDDGWGVVEVTDTGPGFSAETLARAFSAFSTTKPDGAGLGLAISKRIVEEHGGALVADNAGGGGACVRIRLPHRPEES